MLRIAPLRGSQTILKNLQRKEHGFLLIFALCTKFIAGLLPAFLGPW